MNIIQNHDGNNNKIGISSTVLSDIITIMIIIVDVIIVIKILTSLSPFIIINTSISMIINVIAVYLVMQFFSLSKIEKTHIILLRKY